MSLTQPDIVTLGPASRLVSLASIGRELLITTENVRKFIGYLETPIIRISNYEYVNLASLEISLWRRTHNGRGRGGVPPDDNEALDHIRKAGAIYSGLRKEVIQKRLKETLSPCRIDDQRQKPPRRPRGAKS